MGGRGGSPSRPVQTSVRPTWGRTCPRRARLGSARGQRSGHSPGLGQEGAHAAADGGPADGAQLQGGCTLGTDQVAAGHEDSAHGAVQADFAGPLLLQAPQLLSRIPGPWGSRTRRCLGAWAPPCPGGPRVYPRPLPPVLGRRRRAPSPRRQGSWPCPQVGRTLT